MQRLLITLLVMLGVLVLIVLPATGGCDQHVVRDAATYRTELTQWDTWATKQADLLTGFIAANCACQMGPPPRRTGATGADPAEPDSGGLVFTTKPCADAADYVLTVRARHEWQKQMALYNGGLLEERPSKSPPAIPDSSTLCPVPAPEAPPVPAPLPVAGGVL